ncbi:hypothetical protein [Chitinophaga qingshengii]|uniref:Zinc ribbon domain-containing protein n=1 Tax=Chitinophaga qingshengii TaxID=1569794 RepID=A0ABR7TW28_9BACT|nr:hypothetical protein [Chitinophaga qingshengii]MBC9934637.1 hypothetical protein [Chitinophaga qingshengii]
MKYLLCGSCSHANPLKSEYLTFCDACGKKLPNSFADWRKLHPMGSFPEYQQTVGISIKEKKPNAAKAWIKTQLQPANKGKVIVFFSLVLVLLATAGTLFGKKAVFSLLYAKVPKSYLYASWQTATIGRQALEISTPVKLWIHDQPLDPEAAKVTEYAKSYRNEEGGGIRITVNMYSYFENVTNTLENALADSHHTMEPEDMSDMQAKTTPVLVSGIQGRLEEGNYLYKGGIRLAFQNLLVVKGANRWEILIHYRDDDPIGPQVARRVLKSLKIK